MRKLKAIYLIPVFVILCIGAAAAGYYLMIVPQIENTNKAIAAWREAQKTCQASDDDVQSKIDAGRENAAKFYRGHVTFARIQQTMPDLLDVKTVYTGAEEDGLRYWYRTMTTPKLQNELTRWARKYYVNGVPNFSFPSENPMGYEGTLPSVQMVAVDFGKQTIGARGYPALIDQIQRKSGYGFCPLVIGPDGGVIKVTVNRRHPRHSPQKPVLSTTITATGYFMTRGWDPGGSPADVKAQLEKAKAYYDNPPTIEPYRTDFPQGPPPKVLGFIEVSGEPIKP